MGCPPSLKEIRSVREGGKMIVVHLATGEITVECLSLGRRSKTGSSPPLLHLGLGYRDTSKGKHIRTCTRTHVHTHTHTQMYRETQKELHRAKVHTHS